ncbi:MAG: hypothetical protein ACFFDF_22100 [Candidatus Odinarchaeota archaeon]
MSSEFRCPICNSDQFLDYGEYIECTQCGFEFFKEFLDSGIDEENVLTDQELKGFSKAFQDEKDKRRFLKSIDDDLEELKK